MASRLRASVSSQPHPAYSGKASTRRRASRCLCSLGPELGTDRPGGLLWVGMDTHHPAAARLLKPGAGGGPRECRGWHHPDRVEPSIPEVFQQAIRLTHVGGELERAKHALPLNRPQGAGARCPSRYPSRSARSVMEEVLSLLIINVACPPFGMFPLVGRGSSAICPPRSTAKRMKPFSAGYVSSCSCML